MDELTVTPADSSARAAAAQTPWKWLLLIVVVGLALRVGLFSAAFSNPQFQWGDADHYMGGAYNVAKVYRPLAARIVKAASYEYSGFIFYLPPLYTLMLSLFARFPHYPLNAAIGQAVLGAISAVFVYVIGRHLHTNRTGLVAAALYALWPPFVTGGDVFTQEQLYIPLVLAGLALLMSALERDNAMMCFGTGVVFGLAALTRLMILFYVLLLPALIWRPRRDLLSVRRQILPLLLGMSVIVIPYCAFMWSQTGEAMLVENHGGFDMRNYADRPVVGKPTLGVGLEVLVQQITRKPIAFVRTWLEYVRMLFKPNGMRWIESLGVFSTRPAALVAVGLRIVCDVSYLAVIALAPIGVLLARRRWPAVMLAAWIVVVAALTALSGTAGARYRSPAEPALLVLAAVAVTSGWRSRARVPLLCAAAVGLLLVVRLVAQVPGFGLLPPYGLRAWSPEHGIGESTAHGDIGLRVLNAENGVEIVVQPSDALKEMVHVEVTIEGHVLFDRTAETNESVRIVWMRAGAPYLRIRATGDRTGEPIPFRFTILPRPGSRVADVDGMDTSGR